MTDMGISELSVTENGKDFSVVDQGDVVILPAFGASVQEMQILDDKKVQIVDTTCPWVSKVNSSNLCELSFYSMRVKSDMVLLLVFLLVSVKAYMVSVVVELQFLLL